VIAAGPRSAAFVSVDAPNRRSAASRWPRPTASFAALTRTRRTNRLPTSTDATTTPHPRSSTIRDGIRLTHSATRAPRPRAALRYLHSSTAAPKGARTTLLCSGDADSQRSRGRRTGPPPSPGALRRWLVTATGQRRVGVVKSACALARADEGVAWQSWSLSAPGRWRMNWSGVVDGPPSPNPANHHSLGSKRPKYPGR